MENVPLWTEPSLLQRALYSGPLGQAAALTFVVSCVLCLVWLFLVIRRRCLYPLQGVASIALAVAGYLVFDWQHFSLNLSMRDSQRVRDDCMQLLQRPKPTVAGEYRDLRLSSAELPPSFTRLGAKAALVTAETVQIYRHTDWNGGASGFLYDPQRLYPAAATHNYVRATWYRDFYDLRVGGE